MNTYPISPRKDVRACVAESMLRHGQTPPDDHGKPWRYVVEEMYGDHHTYFICKCQFKPITTVVSVLDVVEPLHKATMERFDYFIRGTYADHRFECWVQCQQCGVNYWTVRNAESHPLPAKAVGEAMKRGWSRKHIAMLQRALGTIGVFNLKSPSLKFSLALVQALITMTKRGDVPEVIGAALEVTTQCSERDLDLAVEEWRRSF